MEEVKIQDLIDKCLAYFKENCYTRERIYKYKSLWNKGIIKYMSDSGIEAYSSDVGARFVSTCRYNGTIRHQEREKIRSVQVLDDMLSLGYIRKRCLTPTYHALEGEIGLEMEKFISHLINLRRRNHTIQSYRLYLSEFLTHLKISGVLHINQITEKHILTFMSSLPSNKANVISALRVLFRFWKEEHLADGRYDELFESYKVQKREKIPSYFCTSDVQTIEGSISRSSSVGKRDYAMVLLASRLGLRAADIANLKFSNIDWDADTITIVMQKTNKTIELPLLADVGNAIIDYLQHGRPKSKLLNVFLSCRAPFIAATSAMVGSAVNRIICKSGVDITGRHHGPHSLRHSLASAMLEGGTTLPVISESLGHRSTDATMKYLKIDIRSLVKCALPVPPVADEFYTQKGGAFYV